MTMKPMATSSTPVLQVLSQMRYAEPRYTVPLAKPWTCCKVEAGLNMQATKLPTVQLAFNKHISPVIEMQWAL